MALTTKHRTTIYQRLSPLIGEEEAGALIDEFPAAEHDELVTKQFLRAEMAELRSELRGEMAELRGELRGEMGALRGELRAEIAQSASDLKRWTVGTMFTGMAFAFAIGQALT